MGGGETTNPENMEALYASLQSWGDEEEYDIYWKGVDEYREPVEHNSLSENFVAVFLEAESLLN